jgi:hypothetical protein
MDAATVPPDGPPGDVATAGPTDEITLIEPPDEITIVDPTDELSLSGPPEDGAPGWDPFDEPPPEPFVVPGDPVTRQLCAAVHLHGTFADRVRGQLVDPAHQAMAPNWHIDTVALVRHAEQAVKRREERDLSLLIEFLAGFVVAGSALALFVTARIGVAAFITVLVLGLVIAYLLACTVVWTHYAAVHRSAVAVMGFPGAEAEVPARAAPEVEEALEAAAEANVVLFAGTPPFVGSGTLLDHWTLAVDLGVGQPAEGGGRVDPEPVDQLDLHESLIAGLTASMSPAPTAGHRLYVLGGHATAVGGLFRSGPVPPAGPDAIRFRRPVARIPDEVIKGYLREPHQSARAYTFFELPAWDGQLVVTLFVRTVVRHPVLHVEASICSLRPLRDEFGDVATIPLGPRVHLLPILRTVAPVALPLMFTSPARAFRAVLAGRADRRARKDLELTLARRADVNFAAGPSLREQTGRGDNPNHFGHMDEEMYYAMFTRRSLDCLRDYLAARRLDLTDFEQQQQQVVDKAVANAKRMYTSADERGEG